MAAVAPAAPLPRMTTFACVSAMALPNGAHPANRRLRPLALHIGSGGCKVKQPPDTLHSTASLIQGRVRPLLDLAPERAGYSTLCQRLLEQVGFSTPPGERKHVHRLTCPGRFANHVYRTARGDNRVCPGEHAEIRVVAAAVPDVGVGFGEVRADNGGGSGRSAA